MAEEILASVQVRRDSKANWESVNPILLNGEAAYEQDTDMFKIGDGVKRYSDLPYHNKVGPQGPQGEPGPTPQISMNVSTGNPGTSASVNVTGTAENPVINLTVPRGDTGKTGSTGPKGDTGKTAYQAAKEGGYTGTESEFNSKLAQEIPTALPNPQPITINGQRYDGSEAVTVTTVEIDDTLTQSGKAADAKAVGDQLSALNEANAAQDERLSTLKSDLAAETRRAKEAEDNRIKKFYTSNLGATSIADSDDGAVRNLVISGKSEQRTTNGYQMINQVIPSVNSAPQISIDTIDNGFIITTLSVGAYRQNGAYISPSIAEAGNYTVSAKVSGRGGIIFRFFGSDEEKLAEITISSSKKSGRIEIGEKCKVLAVLLGCHESAVDIGTITTITDIMLEPGDMAHEWEPYTGGAPSPSPDYPQEIKSVEDCTMAVSSEDGTKTQEASIQFALHGNGDVRDELYVYADGTGKLVRRYPETLDPTRTVAEQALETPVETTLTADQVNSLFDLRTYYGGTNIAFASDNGVEPVVNFDYACAMDAFVEYVKAQQGDTREMIYNMDDRLTQAEVTALEAAIDAQIAQAMMEV